MSYTLPPLPYAYDALEPAISKQIMTLHHDKHHQTYVNNLNAALNNAASLQSANDIPGQVANLQAIKFNGGGHINHSLFWQNLTPPGSSTLATDGPKLSAAISATWGGQTQFQEAFTKALLGLQGSGWGWLVQHQGTGTLSITTTKDQDPVAAEEVPIFGVDMWEHAYYLQVSHDHFLSICYMREVVMLTRGVPSRST